MSSPKDDRAPVGSFVIPASNADDSSESDETRENRHQVYRKIDAIERLVSELHGAVVGNAFGHDGLIKRVTAIELAIDTKAERSDLMRLAKKVDQHDRKLLIGVAFLTAIWAALVAFKDKIFP